MTRILYNAGIVTETGVRTGALRIDGAVIGAVRYADEAGYDDFIRSCPETEDLRGKVLMAGGIDAHVHFREPGMTRKAGIASESAAALLGGVTAFIDMPNTLPPTVDGAALDAKLALAAVSARIHYGFHVGATNDNLAELERLCREHPGSFGGIKVFMGSSTGNLLVDRDSALEALFPLRGKAILIHSEDESLVRAGLAAAKARFGGDIPVREHPVIRSREACIRSTAKALELALRHGTRLHILHVTTAEEIDMIRVAKGYSPDITAETSANYLWFCDEDYDRLGTRLKCNPAVKTARDREALRKGLKDGVIDTVGSDHAPHLPEEKDRPYLSAPSGMPSVQYSLPVLLTVAARENIPLSRISDAFSGRIAGILGIRGRGRIAPGMAADLVAIRPETVFTVRGTASRCGWTPYEGATLKGAVDSVWLNGERAVERGELTGKGKPEALEFTR